MVSVHLPFICHKTQEFAPKHWQIQTIRWGGGGGHLVPEIRRGDPVSKKFFLALRASFWLKNKAGGGGGEGGGGGGGAGPPCPSLGSTTELIHIICKGDSNGTLSQLEEMPPLFLWIRLQQRTMLLKVINTSYQRPCSLLKSSNYYLVRVKLKKTCALSGKSSLKTLTAIKKSKDPFSSLDKDGSSPMTGSSHGPRQRVSTQRKFGQRVLPQPGERERESLEREKGKLAHPTHSCAPKFPLSLALLMPAMQASAAFKP